MDLANKRFEVGRDKTDAGMRDVDMLPLLREILTEHKAASARTGPDDRVFVTSSGKPRSRHNLRQDVVDAVMIHANRLVEERGLRTNPPTARPAPEKQKAQPGQGFPKSGRPDLNWGPHRPELWAKSEGALRSTCKSTGSGSSSPLSEPRI
ncbi:MAG: hypothetical protein ACYC91_18690 [Solirubrobacteraceae bacterium]